VFISSPLVYAGWGINRRDTRTQIQFSDGYSTRDVLLTSELRRQQQIFTYSARRTRSLPFQQLFTKTQIVRQRDVKGAFGNRFGTLGATRGRPDAFGNPLRAAR